MRARAIACASIWVGLLACSAVDPAHAPRVNEDCAYACGSGPALSRGAGDDRSADPGPSPPPPDVDAAPPVVTSSADVGGIVRYVPSFTADPLTGSAPGMHLVVSSATPGRTPVDVAADGSFGIYGVDRTTEPFVWLAFTQIGGKGRRIETLFGAIPDGPAAVVPIYPFESTLDWASRLGASGSGTAAIVVRLVTDAGAPALGVSARPIIGAAGPYYDDGAGGLAMGDGTGPSGVVVYLQVPTDASTVAVPLARTKQPSIPVRVASNTISYVQLVW